MKAPQNPQLAGKILRDAAGSDYMDFARMRG